MSRSAGRCVLIALLLATGCSDDDSGDLETFCAKVQEFNDDTQAFDLNVAEEAEVESIVSLLDQIQEVAPSEISDDIETHFAYVDDVVAASQGDDEAAARLAEAQPTAEEEDRINVFTEEQCGIALEPDSTAPSSPGTTLPSVAPATTAPPATVPPATVPPTTVAP